MKLTIMIPPVTLTQIPQLNRIHLASKEQLTNLVVSTLIQIFLQPQ